MQVIIKRDQSGEVSMVDDDQKTMAVMSHGQFKKKFGFRLLKGSEGLYQLSLKVIERQVTNGKNE